MRTLRSPHAPNHLKSITGTSDVKSITRARHVKLTRNRRAFSHLSFSWACVLFIAATLIASNCAMPQAYSQNKSAQQLSEEMRSIFSGMASADTPGFAVLVKKDGKVIFENGYGLRDLRTKTTIDAQTNFRLASFAKQFTAMAIMLLVHHGKLRYDRSLTELFPDFPTYEKTITVRNLLNHNSGLPDYEDMMESFEKKNGSTWTPEKQIK